jgi:NAD(P)-dependent dehydrogenase (short-subunit alcohol dehydrogenase family)
LHRLIVGLLVILETGPQLIAYSHTAISKAASIHLAKGLAKTLAPDVTVNAIAPGLMLTDWAAGFSQEQLDAIEQASALKRHITVEDVADVYCRSFCSAKRVLNGSERSDAGPEPIYHGDRFRLDGITVSPVAQGQVIEVSAGSGL